MARSSADPVRSRTADHVNRRIDDAMLASMERFVGRPEGAISYRIRRLDRERDVERVLEANAATLTLGAVLAGVFVPRRWLLLAGVVPAFLLQHAVQGWCPPVEVVRRWGARTRREIDLERTAMIGVGVTASAGRTVPW
ncbi:MAG: DUF2892 domain-containing protein [Actinomycetales bacterium]|nr:DUF2892 domain-containing protein [Actinomycetales bacterium]